jgi:pimeloyl-ACP methyl ester carboxylesterase
VPWLSDTPLWEAFGTRALFHTAYGGADFGECRRAIDAAGDGGADEWHKAWTDLADELCNTAMRSAAKGHRVSAREAYVRAATYYRVGSYPLYGGPTDDRVKRVFEREEAAFASAASLHDHPVELVEIPFENGRTLPGIFVAPSDDGTPRPTVVHTNGSDSNVHELFVAHVDAGVQRGYNVLVYDGPGQGRNLIRDGLPIRPDWEKVAGPVVDYARERAEVDADKVVLAGWGFGGYLAPRAAAFLGDKLAAVWADPGLWDQLESFRARLPLSDEDKAAFPDVDPAKLEPMEDWLRGPEADADLHWRLIQRGLWVHGKDTLYEYFADLARFELSSVAANITCPALLTAAEGDPLSADAPKLLNAIGSERKKLIAFTQAEGAGGHCEGTARRLFHQRCYDWLDETLAAPAS